MTDSRIDVNETLLREQCPEALRALLRCHSSYTEAGSPEGHEGEYLIIWATDDYVDRGEGYGFHDQITPDKITGENGKLIQPRVLKSSEVQNRRVKDKAEVFTPSWVCNAQNNLVDEAWFGRTNVFNTENPNHSWTTTAEPISFPEGKTWQDYVKAQRLEMCCGEAPYLTSRYDTVSGDYIPVENRIGLLDRKLRVINENVGREKQNIREWLDRAKDALKSTYAFEWQGDSLLLARENILYTVLDFYESHFGERLVVEDKIKQLAYIISWNIFQMDALKMVVPGSCGEKPVPGMFDFGDGSNIAPCTGCKTGIYKDHNGIKVHIRDWTYSRGHKNAKPYFYTLIKQSKK